MKLSDRGTKNIDKTPNSIILLISSTVSFISHQLLSVFGLHVKYNGFFSILHSILGRAIYPLRDNSTFLPAISRAVLYSTRYIT